MVKVITIPVHGRPGVKDTATDVDALQRLIDGGFIESLSLGKHLALWFDEDGLAKKLLRNVVATQIAWRRIVGPAVLIRSDNDGNLVDVTDAEYEPVLRLAPPDPPVHEQIQAAAEAVAAHYEDPK